MKKILTLGLLTLGAVTLTACNKGPSEPYAIDAPTENLVNYSDVTLASATEKGDKVVVFFGASRCPGCVAFEENIAQNADLIPEGVTFMAADFDADVAAKEKYGVEKKHTTVYLSAEGEVIKVNSGKEYNIQDMLAELETI